MGQLIQLAEKIEAKLGEMTNEYFKEHSLEYFTKQMEIWLEALSFNSKEHDIPNQKGN